MRTPRSAGRALLSLLLIGGTGVLLAGSPLGVALGIGTGASAQAPLRAGSVCEAHELKARKAADPSLEIEIPPEHDKEFPSPLACRAHEASWDPQAPGPNQPIPFSHAHHARDWEIECNYCHSGTDRSRMAGVPSVGLCMGCHAAFPAEYDQLEGIQILKRHWAEKQPIPWVQLHRLPEHAKFRHNRHVSEYAKGKGIECQTCHGPVQEMDKLYVTPDTKWWPWALPAKKLEMGWCIQCHRQNEVTQDCYACHY
jgi:hypothetical protein